MKICIVGDSGDLSAIYLAWRAKARGVDIVELWEENFGLQWTFKACEEHFSSSIEVNAQGKIHSDNSFAGAIVRLNPRPIVPKKLGVPSEAESLYVLERRYGLHYFLNRINCPVVNRPNAGRSNCSKPYQMLFLSREGFKIPKWIVTNEANKAKTFIESCSKGAIYKACSGLRARVKRADEELLEKIANGVAPVLIQEYIPGCDVRVHVVGSKLFATEINSKAVDYRFDELPTQYRTASLPPVLAEQCIATTVKEGLLLAGFDFRRDNEGQYCCLEVNPVPTFLPYEAGSGQPIGDAILDLFGELPVPAQTNSPLTEFVEESDHPLIV